MFLLIRKKTRKIQNTENGCSNGLFIYVRLMTPFLMHHQQPTDYTIELQQHHNGTKNINIIFLLSLKHFSCTAQTKNKQIMTLQRQLNRSAFFLHLVSNHVERFVIAVQHTLWQTGTALRWLISHLVISSKWLPEFFNKIFMEYLRAKLQAPVPGYDK